MTDPSPARTANGLGVRVVRTDLRADAQFARSQSGGERGAREPPPRRRPHPVAYRLLDAVAFVLVLGALLAPNTPRDLTSWAFLRLPIEAVAAGGLVLVLPPRGARVLAVVGGVALGLLMIGKIFDMGFYEVMLRPSTRCSTGRWWATRWSS